MKLLRERAQIASFIQQRLQWNYATAIQQRNHHSFCTIRVLCTDILRFLDTLKSNTDDLVQKYNADMNNNNNDKHHVIFQFNKYLGIYPETNFNIDMEFLQNLSNVMTEVNDDVVTGSVDGSADESVD
ncbi:9564_t:CDS:2 [Paraglomus occultum]|uniref:9564_t:CDS:1 n=1 Tax=Paraglomus occultum TaxID=144539 RepID=A0A9N9G151_9GLOM|nr:9564_t:CDS:2 [Paraglomus occultum]